MLTDFYMDRGFIDFRVLDVTSEIARGRDGVFITVQVQEGQRYRFGATGVASRIPGVDEAAFAREIRVRPGTVYTPVAIERTILAMEERAIREGIDFLRVEPRLVRDPRNLQVGVQFVLTRGPRVFVERIDIEGNNTTLDRVVRRQFDTVEGDPFNPRAIRAAAERIRALGYFEEAEVSSREGSTPGQVVIDVDVVEANTGTLSFGASYGADSGFGVTVGLRESNFLGRGQQLAFSINTASENASGSLRFFEPALLGRDLGGGIELFYRTTDNFNAVFDTRSVGFSPSIEFPVGEDSRLALRYTVQSDDLSVEEIDRVFVSPILLREADQGDLLTSSVGYTFSYDTRASGFNPDTGVLLRFGQDFAGLGGGYAVRQLDRAGRRVPPPLARRCHAQGRARGRRRGGAGRLRPPRDRALLHLGPLVPGLRVPRYRPPRPSEPGRGSARRASTSRWRASRRASRSASPRSTASAAARSSTWAPSGACRIPTARTARRWTTASRCAPRWGSPSSSRRRSGRCGSTSRRPSSRRISTATGPSTSPSRPSSRRLVRVAIALAAALAAAPLAAQEGSSLSLGQADLAAPPSGRLLVIDRDRVLSGSERGQAMLAALEEATAALEEENRGIEERLRAEERDLTERRPAMEPAAFPRRGGGLRRPRARHPRGPARQGPRDPRTGGGAPAPLLGRGRAHPRRHPCRSAARWSCSTGSRCSCRPTAPTSPPRRSRVSTRPPRPAARPRGGRPPSPRGRAGLTAGGATADDGAEAPPPAGAPALDD